MNIASFAITRAAYWQGCAPKAAAKVHKSVERRKLIVESFIFSIIFLSFSYSFTL